MSLWTYMCISICVQGLNKIPKWSDQNFSLVIKACIFLIVKLLSWPARVAANF